MLDAHVTRTHESRHGATLTIGGDRCRVLVAAAQTGGSLSVLEWQGSAPGGPPLHLHHDQDEVFIVEEGQYLFQVGEQQHRLGPGDTIFLPRGVPHGFCQLGASGRLRYLYTPAGRMEAFFAALASVDGPPGPAAAEALFAAHGMQVVGPPLQPV
jgi:quercetin 2,3-dioxygenase